MIISASMIVKDEEDCIEACLESIKGIDEIVILDTGSTDRTPEICRRYTDKVHVGEYAWRDDFSEARNESLKRCSGDWILIIDADEVLSTGVSRLRSEITYASGETVLMAKIRTGDTRFWSPRIFRNKVGIHWRGAVHNYLTRTGTKKTSVAIECGSSRNHIKDPDRSFRILKREVVRKPDCVREKYYLAREYYYRKDWSNAVWWFESYLVKAVWPPEWADAWCLLAQCYLRLGDHKKAKDACFQALSINADFVEPLLMLAALSGPKNRKKWQSFAAVSKNEGVLFVRDMSRNEIIQ